MNSKKNFLFLIITIVTVSCGVKAPPLKYPETIIDSYTKSYTGGEPTPEELERAEKNQEAETKAQAEKDKIDNAGLLNLPSPTK